jgi:hypothetical protein
MQVLERRLDAGHVDVHRAVLVEPAKMVRNPTKPNGLRHARQLARSAPQIMKRRARNAVRHSQDPPPLLSEPEDPGDQLRSVSRF